jgi:endonuclease YncB( thermonuclease family)
VVRSNPSVPQTARLKRALFCSALFYVLLTAPAFADSGSNNPSGADEPVLCPPQRIEQTARVNYVYDGDTLQLESGRKIRLIGIDTPEVFSRKHHIPADIKQQGLEARDALQALLNQSSRQVQLAYGQQARDRYGRTLAHVFLPDGTNLQAELISRGHAIAFTTPPNDRMSDCYRTQEQRARQQQLGIWQLPQYQIRYTQHTLGHLGGFHRLQGQVTEVTQSKSRIRLQLGPQLEINIYKNDWTNFSLHQLLNLQGKTVRVRGWVKPLKHSNKTADTPPRYRLTLRHRDALTQDVSTK